MKTVFVTEQIHEDGMEILQQDFKTVVGTIIDPETIEREAQGCEGMLVRSAKISGDLMRRLPNLKVIGKHGIGVDNIDVEEATRLGILVVNAPTSNIHSVAEHTMGMILALSKNFAFMDQKVRHGDFAFRNKFINTELRGKTVGLIGIGKIGMLLVKMIQGLDMKIIAYDPFVSPEVVSALDVKLVDDIDKIYMESDFVSVHVPLTTKTNGLVGIREFKKMKKTAFIINAARGSIVNEHDLYEALITGEIKGAGLDVFEEEPPAADNPLFKLDNVLLSPHNAALTSEALVAMATHSAQGISDYLNGIKPTYMVNGEVCKI